MKSCHLTSKNHSLRTQGKMALNYTNEMDLQFPGVDIKKEFPSEKPISGSINCEQANATILKDETELFLENDASDVSELGALQPDSKICVKTESDELSDITHNLVGYFPKYLTSERCVSPPTIKVENSSEYFHYNNRTPTNADSSALPIFVDHKSTNRACEKTVNEPLIDPKIYYDSNKINFINVIVLLEDLFPVNLRNAGKAHVNSVSCSCLYCRGEFRYSDHTVSKDKLNGQSQSKAQSELLQKKHCGKRSIMCHLCPKKFEWPSRLKAHLLVHSNKRSFKCELCPAKFKESQTLKNHLKIHRDERLFKCEQCPAKFISRYFLKNHLLMHSGERSFECKQCPAKFFLLSALKRHIQVHDAKRPFECEQCKDRFKRKYCLELHMRIHTGEKPYKCKHCPAEFIQRSNLNVHTMHKHSSERRFKCEQCSAKFKSTASLNNHRKVHRDEKLYKCKLCAAKFRHGSTLKMHSVKVHKEE